MTLSTLPVEPAPAAHAAAFEGLLEELERLRTLAERATACAGRFSDAAIAVVVADLRARADEVAGTLDQLAVGLERAVAEVRAEQRAALEEATTARFRVEERALRREIGALEVSDADEPGDADAIAALDGRVAVLGAEAQRLADLVQRWWACGTGAFDALPDEVGADAELPAPVADAVPHLVLDEGTPDERVVLLPDGEPLRIGRCRDNGVALRGDPQASRRHAELTREGDAVVIVDLASANGTLVNGELIDGPRRLYGGEELIVGATPLRFRFSR